MDNKGGWMGMARSGRLAGKGWRRSGWRSAVAWLLTAALVMGSPAYTWAQSQDIPDVPRGHWAYDAVSELVQKGYVSTFDDGTFRGDQAVDRYTFAAAVHQILRQVETGLGQVDPADVELLRQLATEFRDELVDFYRLRDNLLASVEESEKSIAVFDETLNRVIDTVVVLEEDQALLREELTRETEALRRALAGESDALHWALLDETRALWDALEKERQERQAFADELQGDVQGQLMDVIADLRAQAASLDERVTQLEQETLEDTLWLTERVEEMYDQIGGLEARVDGLATQMGIDMAQIGTARADINRLRAQLEQLQAALDEHQDVTDERLQELEASLQAQRTELLARMTQLQEEVSAWIEEDGQRLEEGFADLHNRMAAAEAALYMLDQQMSQEHEDIRASLRSLMEETDLLLETSEALIDDVEYLYSQLGDTDRRIATLEERVGFSDEELSMLTDRVREELESQLNLALMREQRIQRELDELKQEFEAYRSEKDQEVRSLRGSTSIAIAVGVIGMLVGLLSK